MYNISEKIKCPIKTKFDWPFVKLHDHELVAYTVGMQSTPRAVQSTPRAVQSTSLLGGSRGMPPRKCLKIYCSEIESKHIFRPIVLLTVLSRSSHVTVLNS